MPEEKKSVGIFLRNIDEKDRRKFKSLCAEEGTDMTAALIGYIKRCIEEECILAKGSSSGC